MKRILYILLLTLSTWSTAHAQGFLELTQQCAPGVHPTAMAAISRVESGFNPFAIGVVGAQLERQPKSEAEAIATAEFLAARGYNFSVGIAQVNRYNLHRHGLDYNSAFQPCSNLRAASLILEDCYVRARTRRPYEQSALQAALSCYYSGNLSTGLKPGPNGQPSYVRKVFDSAIALARRRFGHPIRAVPTTPARTSKRQSMHAELLLRVPAASEVLVGASPDVVHDRVMVFSR